MNNRYLSFTFLFVIMLALCLTAFGCAPTEPEQPTPPSISEEFISLTTGGQKTLTVSDAGENQVVWTSTNPVVASVDGGVVTALSAGNATIKAIVGETTLSCTVKVDMIDATVLILNTNSALENDYKVALYKDQTYTFTPVLACGSKVVDLANITINYHTTDSETVSVQSQTDKTVKVSALKVGKANVWASCDYDGATYTSKKIEVSVKNSTELILSRDSFTFVTSQDLQGNPVHEGSNGRIYVSYRDLTTNEVTPISKNDITFKVLDENIASVDSWGNLTGKAGGTTKLLVKTIYGEGEVDIAVSYPIYTANDLDTLALATYNMGITKASEFLSQTFILMNDIDYNLHVRNYMLPIASLNAQDASQTARDIYLDRDEPRYGEEYGAVSYYSNAWKEILNLTEGYEEFTVTSSAVHEDATVENPVTIQAKRLYKQNGDAFEGINPNGIKFTGVIDGNGYSIKNAWLMLENYLMSGGFEGIVSVTPSYMSGLVGYQSGTVKNIEFENLVIGDAFTVVNNGKYEPTSRAGAYQSYDKSLSANYSIMNSRKTCSATYKANANNAYRFYTEKVMIDGKEKAQSFRRMMPLYEWFQRRVSSANALFILNEGNIENVKMNYIATATWSDTNNCILADGLVLVNDGLVKDSVVERKVYDNNYSTVPQAGRVVFLNRLNGRIDNLYLTTNGIGNNAPLNTKGVIDLTVCETSNALASSVSGLDTNIWNGISLIDGCALRV